MDIMFFWNRNKRKIKTKISINIKPFIKDSSLILFNKHIHHWLVFLIVFIIIIIIKKSNKINKYDYILNILMGYSLFKYYMVCVIRIDLIFQ